jgi:hypothetical protein
METAKQKLSWKQVGREVGLGVREDMRDWTMLLVYAGLVAAVCWDSHSVKAAVVHSLCDVALLMGARILLRPSRSSRSNLTDNTFVNNSPTNG